MATVHVEEYTGLEIETKGKYEKPVYDRIIQELVIPMQAEQPDKPQMQAAE
ncbi:hypothetical protein GW846_01055 [Candidatus Gracilibacteria bacterium]|nr:hypothetical protein [Candidatus Gracilibacteria bacterium]